MRMEVRYSTGLLLGWLPVPEPLAFLGAHVSYALSVPLSVSVDGVPPARTDNVVTFQVDVFDPFNARPYLALNVKAADLEMLRRIKLFTEAL
jgi:hypothetical protein